MSWLKHGWLLFFLPASLLAQYIGDGRPWTAVQSRDSLSAVNQRITGDSTAGLYREGLSFDLDYYFARNVVQITGTDSYSGWVNYNGGEHADDLTHYKTDTQSIEISGSGQYEGAHIPATFFADTNFTLFSDRDSSTNDDYICWAVYLDSTASVNYLDSLGAAGIRFVFNENTVPGGSDFITYNVAKTCFSTGWNYYKVAKSGWSQSGNPSWNNVGCFYAVLLDGSQSSEVKWSIDNIQMVRKDPYSVKPNPFQREFSDGGWVADWLQMGSGNFWVVEESGVLAACAPDYFSSFMYSAKAYDNYRVSGKVRLGNGNSYIWVGAITGLRPAYLSGDVFRMTDSTGGQKTAAFNSLNNDEVYYEFEKSGTSSSARVSLDGQAWTPLAAFTYSGAKKPVLRSFSPMQRIYSFGMSAVAYANHASVADRLRELTIEYENPGGIGVWKFTKGDSAFYFTADSVTAAP